MQSIEERVKELESHAKALGIDTGPALKQAGSDPHDKAIQLAALLLISPEQALNLSVPLETAVGSLRYGGL